MIQGIVVNSHFGSTSWSSRQMQAWFGSSVPSGISTQSASPQGLGWHGSLISHRAPLYPCLQLKFIIKILNNLQISFKKLGEILQKLTSIWHPPIHWIHKFRCSSIWRFHCLQFRRKDWESVADKILLRTHHYSNTLAWENSRFWSDQCQLKVYFFLDNLQSFLTEFTFIENTRAGSII